MTLSRLLTRLLCAICIVQSLHAAASADTLIIKRGERRIFGILHRPDGTEGRKLPLAVIAHGFNGDHRHGRNYFAPLARAGYQCFTLDFPCGSTHSAIDSNTVNMSIRDEQADLMAVVDYFASRPDTDASRIALIGESQGGLVASLAAAAIPDKVHRLVLCFPAFGIPDNYNGSFRSAEEIPDTTYVWKVPLGRRFFSELRDMRPYEEMKKYTRPVLILHGDKDPVTPLAGSEKALRTYPDARLEVIPDAGHGFGPDDFRRSADCIAAFLLDEGTRPLESLFLDPDQRHRPLIIWQWMDGLVTREGITRDLEAFRKAGLAGVQNFQIGGPQQMRIGNPDNAIGSDNWKELLRWTLDECERLGLTFGTHNCPGWSSSAYVDVTPENSMQRLVYSETPVPARQRKIRLERPAVDPQWNYYADVAVMAVPADSTAASASEVIDLTAWFDPSTSTLLLPAGITLPEGGGILRIGQTTNGKTNEAQAPPSGRGLECDKLSRQAVTAFWNGYPSMVIETAGRHAGTTFTHMEIDSYEAGGQTWSPALPGEFLSRAGYDLTPWLPLMAGRLKAIGGQEATAQFMRDWEETIRQCVAENYYGQLTRLAAQSGITMLIEPYGTGGQKPFGIIDFEKIARACEGADIATEFWQAPDWGWKDMKRHEASMRKLRKPLLIAEAFTCWPLRAWQDSPATLKPVCDRAFCTGVNRMMLHAGAANPWPDVLPGMSFGIWGTHFVPGQTWWMAGGARSLFDYMARCQALLQQGLPALEQLPSSDRFKTYRRTDGDTDIIFICNPSDTAASDSISFPTGGRSAEIWDPYTCAMHSAPAGTPLRLDIEPYGSRFLIVRPGESQRPAPAAMTAAASAPLEGTPWSVEFPGADAMVTDTLFSWPDSADPAVRYFSGTAKYRRTIRIPAGLIPAGAQRLILSLGEVREMARVSVNGRQLPLLWKAPYECDITEVAVPGENTLEIEVTNLWPNRMIGDELEPDDLEWSEPLVYSFAPGKPEAGRYLTSNPDWLVNGLPRPSQGRKTVGCFKYFKATSPLLPSGLLGPASLTLLAPAAK